MNFKKLMRFMIFYLSDCFIMMLIVRLNTLLDHVDISYTILWSKAYTCSVARASKPLPMFKGHFDRKRHPFLRIFSLNLGQIFTISRCSHCEHPKILKIWKKEPMFKDIFVEMGFMFTDFL